MSNDQTNHAYTSADLSSSAATLANFEQQRDDGADAPVSAGCEDANREEIKQVGGRVRSVDAWRGLLALARSRRPSLLGSAFEAWHR